MSDQDLIYGIEGRLIDLEAKVAELEKALAQLPSTLPEIPEEAQRRIDAGEHPVRVMRDLRLLTQSQLSELCGIRPNHIDCCINTSNTWRRLGGPGQDAVDDT